MLNWTQASVREGWYWQSDTDTNTLIAVLNSDEQPARVAFSLDYYVGQSKHSYDLPKITIGPHVSELIDLGQMIAAGVPDGDGDVIPAGITFGGYRATLLR